MKDPIITTKKFRLWLDQSSCANHLQLIYHEDYQYEFVVQESQITEKRDIVIEHRSLGLIGVKFIPNLTNKLIVRMPNFELSDTQIITKLQRTFIRIHKDDRPNLFVRAIMKIACIKDKLGGGYVDFTCGYVSIESERAKSQLLISIVLDLLITPISDKNIETQELPNRFPPILNNEEIIRQALLDLIDYQIDRMKAKDIAKSEIYENRKILLVIERELRRLFAETSQDVEQKLAELDDYWINR